MRTTIKTHSSASIKTATLVKLTLYFVKLESEVPQSVGTRACERARHELTCTHPRMQTAIISQSTYLVAASDCNACLIIMQQRHAYERLGQHAALRSSSASFTFPSAPSRSKAAVDKTTR